MGTDYEAIKSASATTKVRRRPNVNLLNLVGIPDRHRWILPTVSRRHEAQWRVMIAAILKLLIADGTDRWICDHSGAYYRTTAWATRRRNVALMITHDLAR